MKRFFEKNTVRMYIQPTRSPLQCAAENLRNDLEQVFEKRVEQVSIDDAELVVMTYDQIEQEPVWKTKIHAEELLDENGKPIWEGYLLAVEGSQLWIVGSDTRGTIYGIYDLTRRLGVSPWYFFADVPVKKRTSFSLQDDFRIVEHPSVQYRGIFINDEEELDHWTKAHTKDGTIGPETYAHIFELLLRLKANYIWPAMHVNYFNGNPENAALASRMGIVVGTSHCDMMLRSNQNEWKPWLASKGYDKLGIQYDYSIPGENREKLLEYWRESVEANKEYEAVYTVGMRGIHDSGFVTREIDRREDLSEDEKREAKKAMLEEVIAEQRKLLETVTGKSADEIPQTFIPYKEVLQYYDNGLKVPEDVTIIWTNDNYGYVRRYPGKAEQSRRGGHGLYYHSSYWSGDNMHYLFISSTPLARMKNELQKAWDNGIQKMWVLNVGALKAIEQDLEFYTRFAWEIGKEKTTKDVEEFLISWINMEFSGGIGEKTGVLLKRFSQITNVRKIEMMHENVFSQVNFGDEAAARLNALQELFEESNAIAETLPEEERDAFFELVQMKIHAAYFKNAEYYFADRSALAYRQGKMQAADEYCRESREYTKLLRGMIYYYNKVLAGGKWDQILTPEVAPPPNMQMYPTTKPALVIGEPSLDVCIWQGAKESESLCFAAGDKKEKWLEVFNRGAGEVPYRIEAPEWLSLSETEGRVSSEERIVIRLLEEKRGAETEGTIRVFCDQRMVREIPVQVAEEQEAADGAVEIFLAEYEKKQNQGMCAWQVRENLGRYEGNAIEAYAPGLESLPEQEMEHLPFVEYHFSVADDCSPVAEFYRLPTLNSVGRIRFGVQIDALPMQIVESEITDEHRGNWADAVRNEADKLYLTLPYLEKGTHTLRLLMIDSYVCLSKCVIYTHGFAATSLGILGRGDQQIPVFAEKWQEQCNIIYHGALQHTSEPDLILANYAFYHQDFIGARLEKLSQKKEGQKTYQPREDGRKDVIRDDLCGKEIQEKDGRIAFEAELALAENANGYTTPSLPGAVPGTWTHIGTPTSGGSGLGMVIEGADGILWSDPKTAPAMHYQIEAEHAGTYKVWLLLKYDGRAGQDLMVGANEYIVRPEERTCPHGIFHFLTTSVWHWHEFASVELKEGKNVFHIFGRSANVKIDRVFLVREELDDALPAADGDWVNTYRE